jgi:hypothetical protein
VGNQGQGERLDAAEGMEALMCEISVDDYCSVFEETPQKARKAHVCSCCRGAIEPGEMYIKHFSIFEREVCSEKMCVLCMLVVAEFQDDHDGARWTPGGMRDALVECVLEERTGDYNEELDEWEPSAAGKKWQRYLDEMDERHKARIGSAP